MTNIHLRTRACKLMGVSPCTGLNVKTASLVYDHFILSGHKILFNDFTESRQLLIGSLY